MEIGECDSLSDLAPVLRWLDTLNLSRYANIFIREEIDWDTFKCLNDEVICELIYYFYKLTFVLFFIEIKMIWYFVRIYVH